MKNKNALFVIGLVLIASLAIVGFSNPVSADYGYKIGDAAAEINLLNVDGKMVSYKDYPNAKGFIVIFTCNTCPYAVASEDRIIALIEDKLVELS